MAVAALIGSTISPVYAVTSSPSAPALSGQPSAPAAGTETAPRDASLTSPAAVAAGFNGLSPSPLGLGGNSASSTTDTSQTAKFTPPDAPYNGAFTRSIPLKVLPFFGHTPKIAFNYSSTDNRMHGGDGFSPLGVGWTLSGGSMIERQSQHGGVPKYDSTDAFALDGDVLLSCTTSSGGTINSPSCNAGGNYTPRYETLQRVRFDTSGNAWTVTDRDGTMMVYQSLGFFNAGGTQDTRLRTQYRWLLSTITDTDGNVQTYSYSCTALPSCYISSISYGTSAISFYWAKADNSVVIGYDDGTAKPTAVYLPGSEQPQSQSSSQSDPDLAAERVTLSFADTDVREFARVLFSELLQRPYSVDPNLQGSITVRSGGEVDGVTALTMARQALQATGNTIILSDGVYRVTGVANNAADASGDTQTFALHFVSGAAARDALTPVLSGRAEIVGTGPTSISIRGDNEVVQLAGTLLTTIDVDRFKASSFGLFPLQSGKAADVAHELQSLYQGANDAEVTLVPIDRLNAVLVVAPHASELDFARDWVARLDHGQDDERTISIYQVKNRDAASLAALLQNIFAKSQPTSGVADPQQQASGSPVLGAQPPLPDDSLRVTADNDSNSLVIWALPKELDAIHQALQRLDTPQEQVYVEATVAEVKLDGELSHGVRWFLQSGNFGAGVTDATNGTVAPEYPGFNFSFKVPQAQVVISALESYTDVTIVSSPQLTVVDHQTATIEVGDQVPVVSKTVQDASTGATVIANDVTFRDTGVILKVTPDIRSSGDVQLNIDQEVSRVEPTTSSQIDSPTISQRKVTSTVLVPDGTAIVLGGLMSASEDNAKGGLPGTQNNILQSIFGSGDQKRERSELIVIIRPVIIRDESDLRSVVAEIKSKLTTVPAAAIN